jgi:HK97 family phage major capsid protein
VYEDANLTVGASSLSVFFGDWKRFYTAILPGTPKLIRDDVTAKGSVLFYYERRCGGQVINSEAVKALKLATTSLYVMEGIG